MSTDRPQTPRQDRDPVGRMGTSENLRVTAPDRLAEIEGIRALHDIPDDISVPVSAGLARALLAVQEIATDVPIQHEARCAVWIRVPECDYRVKDFRAALANVEGV